MYESEAAATPKVFTNKDLAPVSTPTVTATPTASTTQPATLSTEVTKEPYWRERRRAFDAKLHEDMAADKAALDLFLLMEKTGIMRRDPAAYIKAMAEMKRTSEVVSYDVKTLAGELIADAKRAGVPEAWIQPTDR